MTLPGFTTERLVLRQRAPADAEACFTMDQEPEVARFVDGPWDEPVAHRAFIAERIAGPYPDGLGYWTILRRDDASFAGWVMLIPRDAVGPEVEIGWRLVREARGQGYATEAARPVLAHAFETLRLPEIIADIDERNRASIRVAEKLGMRAVATRTGATRTEIRYAAGKRASGAVREKGPGTSP